MQFISRQGGPHHAQGMPEVLNGWAVLAFFT